MFHESLKLTEMKRIMLTLVLAAMSCVAMYAQWESAGMVINGIKYYVYSDGTATVYGYKGSPKGVTIQKEVTYNGNVYPVTHISQKAFNSCGSLRSVVVPESVISIGNSAFEGCSALKSVNIKGSVKMIGERVFAECSSLKDIDLPKSIEYIGFSAFEDCVSLERVNIHGLVREIGEYAFQGCQSLQSLRLPESVKYIGDSAFEECVSLESVNIPAGIASIKAWTFSQCSSLKSVIIPDTVTSIEEYAFSDCESLKELVLPKRLESIGESAFDGCKSLKNVIFPNTVTSIGPSAFYGCESIEEIILPDMITSIEERTFSFSSLKRVEIPSSVRSIGDRAFSYSELTSVFIPDGVVSIGEAAFESCHELTSVRLPSSLKSIGKDAFRSTPSKKTMTVSSSEQLDWLADNFQTGAPMIVAKEERDDLKDAMIQKADSLFNLGLKFRDNSEYEQAIDLLEQCAEIRKEVLGDRDMSYENALSNIETIYSTAIGDYGKAIEFAAKVIEIMKEKKDQLYQYANDLYGQSLNYLMVGNYAKAIELCTESMEIKKEDQSSLGLWDYAGKLKDLVGYYPYVGDYAKAIEIGNEAMELCTENHIAYTYAPTIMGNLANCYRALGNNDKAMELWKRASEIGMELYGKSPFDYASSLTDIGIHYTDIGDYGKALELYTEALGIVGDIYGTRCFSYAIELNNIGFCYMNLGDYAKAKEYGVQALDIFKEVAGDRPWTYIHVFENMSNCLSRLGENEGAIEYGKRVVDLRKELNGEDHPEYANALFSLSKVYSSAGDYAQAVPTAQEALGITTGNLRKNFSFLPAFDRSKYWDKVGTNVAGVASLCVEYPSDESNAMAYDVELLSKGILLSSEREFDKVIQSSGDEELLAKFERLRMDRQQIEVWNKKPVEERPANEVARLESEAEQLEKDLIEGSREYGDFTRSLAIEWKDVRDALRDGDVAIELAKVAVDTTDNYVALLLRKGWKAPKCVNLGTANDFALYLSMGANDLYRSQQFSDMVWAGIVKAAGLQEGENVYFSPDGIFYQIAVENLPTTDGQIMADRFNICRLSSTRELCMTPSATAENSAVLYGGLRYDRRRDDDGASKTAATEGENRDIYIGMLLAERSLSEDDSDRGTIQYLPGTLAEADTLAAMLSQKQIYYAEYTGYDGTEESFKAMSGTAPKLIHIATHGFYLSPTEAEELSQRRQRGFLTSGDDSQNSVIDFSMSRSGLLFSGSQPAWFGRPIPEGVDDGILTAKEIAGLDLKGAELAVLSACSTANGEVTGDGVAGLQRGFKKAGVKSLLMTLWPVSDNATQLFMTKFYESLTSGMTKRQAFYAAVRFLRESDDYSEPQYWAPFILLD